jgi:transketolase
VDIPVSVELETASRIRSRMVQLAIARRGAYLAQACSSAEILATLYLRLMRLGPASSIRAAARTEGPPRPGDAGTQGCDFNGPRDGVHDRFVLSPAHYAAALYVTLVEVGRLDGRDLTHYGEDGSSLEMIGSEQSPGMEATTGSLAQGLSVALGMAAARMIKAQPGTIWVLISDGELEEGQTWEAFAAAAHHRLGNVVVLIDANSLQVDGAPREVMNMEPIAEKVRYFGWDTHEVDGHDPQAIAAAAARRRPGVPMCIVCRTTPWQGLPSLRQRYPERLHFVRFKPGEEEAVLSDAAAGLTSSVVPQ